MMSGRNVDFLMSNAARWRKFVIFRGLLIENCLHLKRLSSQSKVRRLSYATIPFQVTGLNIYSPSTRTIMYNKVAGFCRQNNAVKCDCHFHIGFTMTFGKFSYKLSYIPLSLLWK